MLFENSLNNLSNCLLWGTMILDSFSDSALISRVILDDDRHAFSELVRRYQSEVRSLLRRLTNGEAQTADDLAQETFIRAYNHIRKYKGDAKFSTWLYRIAYNCFLSFTHKNGTIEYRETLDEHQSIDSSTQQAMDRFDLQKAMVDLNDNERCAIHLFYVNQLTHEEMAETMNCPLGSVKTLLLRAKEKLKERFKVLERIAV